MKNLIIIAVVIILVIIGLIFFVQRPKQDVDTQLKDIESIINDAGTGGVDTSELEEGEVVSPGTQPGFQPSAPLPQSPAGTPPPPAAPPQPTGRTTTPNVDSEIGDIESIINDAGTGGIDIEDL